MLETKVASYRVGVVDLPLEQPFAAGRWVLTEASNAVLELRSEDGLTGIGYAFTFRRGHSELIARAVELLAAEVVGRNAMAVERIRAALFQATNFLGHGGVVTSAIGVIDMALWDLKARALGLPLYRLLGGESPRVSVYASGGPHNQSEAELERELAAYVEAGYRAVKIKVGGEPEAVVRRVAAARRILGDDVALMVDANQAWSPKQALDLAQRLGEYRLYWLEEPLPYWQLEPMAELRRSLAVKIALGETLYGERELTRALEVGATDVIMPNLQKAGGVTGWLEVARAAAQRGCAVSSHTFCEMSGHLMAACANADYMEYMPWWRGLFANPFDVVAGELVLVDDRPGLGLEFGKRVWG